MLILALVTRVSRESAGSILELQLDSHVLAQVHILGIGVREGRRRGVIEGNTGAPPADHVSVIIEG